MKMKQKLLLIVMTLGMSHICLNAQEIALNSKGEYEKVIVEQFDGMDAQTLYLNTLGALSYWNSVVHEAGYLKIAVKDKEAALIISQGNVYVGFEDFWQIYAEFSLKVRCKDGKAQFSVIVPSMRFKKYEGEEDYSFTLPFVMTDNNARKILRIKNVFTYIDKLPQAVDNMLVYIKEKTHTGDSDF